MSLGMSPDISFRPRYSYYLGSWKFLGCIDSQPAAGYYIPERIVFSQRRLLNERRTDWSAGRKSHRRSAMTHPASSSHLLSGNFGDSPSPASEVTQVPLPRHKNRPSWIQGSDFRFRSCSHELRGSKCSGPEVSSGAVGPDRPELRGLGKHIGNMPEFVRLGHLGS